MTDKTDAWMPLWIGAYLADTMKLTTLQHGAYLLLLMAYWRERSPLPDSDDELRAITKTERAEWKAVRPILARFFKVGEGVWWHKRVEAEIAAADKRKAGAVGKAKAAAEARWGHANADAPSTPQALPEDCPTPPPIPEQEKAPTVLVAGTAYRLPACPAEEIVERYREALPQLPGVEVLNASRKRTIAARWREVCAAEKFDRQQGLDWFAWFFGHVSRSGFLTGRLPGKTWRADFDFLMTASKFAKVIEGSYHKDAA